ncbi:hypothetical protein C8N35_102183 [Breoghania corrubedonensis]|uniref:Uncharacterized protein n=1 Tax=Breoghania corrubedonensis TaxID=665038 RepID=A0A2T5VCI3_9HYPH|nr:hypothetical protein C8N35_102183 [Breoghania corrubedonensis]
MGDRYHCRPDPRIFGEGKEQRLVGHEEFQDAGQEAGLCRRIAQRLGPQARECEEAAQMIRLAGNIAQGLYGNPLRFLGRQCAVSTEFDHLFAFPKRISISLFTDIRGTGLPNVRNGEVPVRTPSAVLAPPVEAS